LYCYSILLLLIPQSSCSLSFPTSLSLSLSLSLSHFPPSTLLHNSIHATSVIRNNNKSKEHPLKKIQNGGGPCTMSPSANNNANNTNSTLPKFCGGPTRGVCQPKSPSTCKCLDGWTGPHCTNPMGYDDILWDPPETLADLGFRGPSLKLVSGGVVFLGLLVVGLFVAPMVFRQRRRATVGYVPVRGAVAPEYERKVGI
jgi:hypothetical protein